MGVLEGVRLALATIWTHKLRSGLTLLANFVAVMSVIAVVSILAGMDTYVKQTVASEGSGVFYVQRVDQLKILTNFESFLQSLRNPNLGQDDADFLRDRMQLAEFVAAERSQPARVSCGERYIENIDIRGRTAEYALMRNWKLASGRHLAPMEVSRNSAVAVIGWKVKEALFPDSDPIDQTVKVAGRHLRVVGVVEEQGSILGRDQDQFVFVPLGLFEKMFGSWDSIGIAIRAADLDRIHETMDEATFFMRMRHGLRPKQRDNFAVTSAEGLISLWGSISRSIFLSLTGISAISLLIGGIIIMNIMLVSVTERTREIGIRKAVGAKRSGILLQVLAEAMTLSLIGGMAGIAFGFLVASLVAAFSPLPYAIEPWSIIAGVIVTAASGLVFGLYPANRAASLDPIEALRVE
jgi:putative ABC transport system permease protein